MPTLKLHKINRWLLIAVVAWISGFFVMSGLFVLFGVLTVPPAYHALLIAGMFFTGAPATFMIVLVWIPPPDSGLSSD